MGLTCVLLLLFLFWAQTGFSAEKDYSTPGWREEMEILGKKFSFIRLKPAWGEDKDGRAFLKADSPDAIAGMSSYSAVKVLSRKRPSFKLFVGNLDITVEYPATDGFDGYRIKDFDEIRKFQEAVRGLPGFVKMLKSIFPMPENPTYLYFRHKDGAEPYIMTEPNGKTWNVADFTKFKQGN